jgi:hypothetical protein
LRRRASLEARRRSSCCVDARSASLAYEEVLSAAPVTRMLLADGEDGDLRHRRDRLRAERTDRGGAPGVTWMKRHRIREAPAALWLAARVAPRSRGDALLLVRDRHGAHVIGGS